jgi:CDP-diacylglycerol--serine O-phosphatidyltransferase
MADMKPDQPPAPAPKREIALIQFLPNAITLGAIAAGVTALRMAFAGNLDLAMLLILLAAILDGLDGRIARVLGSESPIGAELDSLADLVNFGVAPAFILGVWGLNSVPVLGWGAAIFYVICAALRLARFNVGIKSGTAIDGRFFTGVPSPAGALLALSPIILSYASPALTPPGFVSAIWLILCGALMISRVPSFSLKTRIPRAWKTPGLFLLVVVFASLVFFPWSTLLAFNLAYVISIPVAAWRAALMPVEPPAQPTAVAGE